MKKSFVLTLICFTFGLIFLSTLSAGAFSNIFSGITGNVVDSAVCIDSDNGKEIYTFGNVSRGKDIQSDKCIVYNRKIKEYYCKENGRYAYEILSCGKEYKCLNGACVNKTQTTAQVTTTSTTQIQTNVTIIPTECTPQTKQCFGEKIYKTCSKNGNWSILFACPSTRPYCSEGNCYQCSNDSPCISQFGENYKCLNGACTRYAR